MRAKTNMLGKWTVPFSAHPSTFETDSCYFYFEISLFYIFLSFALFYFFVPVMNSKWYSLLTETLIRAAEEDVAQQGSNLIISQLTEMNVHIKAVTLKSNYAWSQLNYCMQYIESMKLKLAY